MKIIVWGCLIAQMKHQDTLIATQKTSTFCNVPLLKKNQENPQKCFFSFSKITILGGFLNFFMNSILQKVEIFCAAISASWRFIRAIKHLHTMIFIFWLKMVFLLPISNPWCGGKNIILK